METPRIFRVVQFELAIVCNLFSSSTVEPVHILWHGSSILTEYQKDPFRYVETHRHSSVYTT